MNKQTLTLILSLFAVLLLVLTNPEDNDHKAAVKAKANTFMQQRVKGNTASGEGEGLALLVGTFVIDKMIDIGITRSNYLLFSTTNFSFEGKSKTIGVGILGNVFISSEIDEALNNQKKQ